ncbi:MAG: hypothetical protein QY322_03640 [bacterium]|nr:MAG: hypothetical protein QY322_03640 [bacterium]
MTKFQKSLLKILIFGLLITLFLILRQQEISRCKNFYSEVEKEKAKSTFWFKPSGLEKPYNYCSWVLYGFKYTK